jgi:tRNA (cmo5U34)-methyltransferase
MDKSKHMHSRDEIFRDRIKSISDFQFDSKVASVFDDMLVRSVPFYEEIQRMILEMVQDFAVDGTHIYDLGCSTGTTLLGIDHALSKSVNLVGIDNSDEMLAKCREKFEKFGVTSKFELLNADLNSSFPIKNASVVVMILTLQFVRPLYREPLIRSIYEGLNQQGCLLIVEKVLGEDSVFNRLFIEYYYRMKKRQGYSEMEISQKREALENVLVPYRLMENRELILNVGFQCVDVFFKWYNFCGIVAIK